MTERPERAAPFVCWLAAIALVMAAVVGFGSWGMACSETARRSMLADIPTVLASVPPPAARREAVVVILGDSLARCAIDDEDGWSRDLSALLKRKARVVVIAQGRLSFEDLEPVSSRLVALDPDLLLVQQELLQQQSRPDAATFAKNLVAATRHFFAEAVRGEEIAEQGNTPQSPLMRCLVPRSHIGVETVSKRAADYYRKPNLSHSAADFLRTARARGIKVAVLELERAPAVEVHVHTLVASWREQVLEPLAASGLFPVWHIEGPRDDASYIDHSHLNSTGRRLTRRRMVPMLADALETR